ncbi:MAG TPA: Fur family transcriptional regulator [Bacillota bacterium]
MSIRRILEALSSNDYRVTWQRWAVAAHIALKGDQLFSVEDLYTSLKGYYPDIGLTTVYRTLDLLVDLGVITRMHADDGTARYGMRVPGVSCAVDLTCEMCGDTRRIEVDQLQPLLQAAAADAEMLLTSCEVRLFGLCSRCRQSAGRHGGLAEPARGPSSHEPPLKTGRRSNESHRLQG